ncbi:MAG: hypothetical protein JSR18_07830 [Proteobacteria bacterium]|nr:hypothetical protein [Pseudomonadota bacterium]
MLKHIPIWVFALLGGLLIVGIAQSRRREVRPPVSLATSLGLAAYSLWGVTGAFPGSALPLAGWVVGTGIAVTMGARWLAPKGVAYLPERDRVVIPGSWTPMVLILGIFAVKFWLGFAAGTGAPVPPHSAAAACAGVVLGALSGGFTVRALTVWRARNGQ